MMTATLLSTGSRVRWRDPDTGLYRWGRIVDATDKSIDVDVLETGHDPIRIRKNLVHGHAYGWGLIDEKAAAEHLNLTDRAMQAFRQRGDGPKYIRISSRCIRYRRVDLKAWADARMRVSTSDPGQEVA